MPRPVAAAAAIVAAAGLLAACDKPVPKITIQSGSFSTTITPSTYAFDASHVRTSAPDLPEISAKPDATVLIDVPHEVADRGWAVEAVSLDHATAAPTDVSGAIENQHSYRIAANANNLKPFIVQVIELRNRKPDGSKWSFLVKVSQDS